MKIVLFDTETTGLVRPGPADLKLQPYITEFYACKIDEEFTMLGEVDTLIRPPIKIPDEVIKISGITDEMVKESPVFPMVFSQLASFFTGVDILVAHNLPFDRDVLKNELLRIDKLLKFPWPRHHLCTVEKTYHLRGHRLKLSQLHELATGQGHSGAHRAKNDVFALVRCLHWLTEKGHINLKDYDK